MKFLRMIAIMACTIALGACASRGTQGMSEFERDLEISDMSNDYNRLIGDLRGEIRDGKFQVAKLEKMLAIQIASTLFFDSGKDQLKESSYPLLLQVAKGLKKIRGKQFRIGGHADDIPIGEKLQGRFETNWELSASRAVKVARFLQEKGGIDPKLLMAVGYGSFRPIRSNSTTKGRIQNRRMEIAIVNP